MRSRDRALVALLQEVSADDVFPPAPPLASSVRRRIEAGPRPVATIRLPRTRAAAWRPVLVSVAVVAVAIGVTLSISATARRAVADLLGVAGIHITFGDDRGASPPRDRIYLGERVSLEEASERAGFAVEVPDPSAVGAPGPAVYYDPTIAADGMVSLVYPQDARKRRDMDVLVTQFEAPLDGVFVKKVATTQELTFVNVGDARGYWISGKPHLVYSVGGAETPLGMVRFAGNVLLWADDGITYRVEGPRSLARALRIAQSLD